MVKQWKIEVKQERKRDGSYNRAKYSVKYNSFTKRRALQKIWHQARLRSLPTNDYLYRIKCSDTYKCRYDNERETIDHLLLECVGYKQERGNLLYRKNEGNDNLKVILDEDRPPPIKRKICTNILKIFKRRKVNNCEVKIQDK